MRQYLPDWSWIKTYDRSKISGDLIAGLTVGVMLVPQGMAYSMLAGLPPIYGLYASTIPLLIYALLGTSRQLAVGPVAMVALLIANGVGAIAELGSPEFVSLAILLSLMVGVIQFALGVVRAGFIVNFLAHPVISGFTSAAAIIIGVSQLKHLFGLSIGRGKVHETVIALYNNVSDINWITFGIGTTAILILVIFKNLKTKLPAPLIVVALSILTVWFMGLHEQGVSIVRDVPSGLPPIGIPIWNQDAILSLLPMALTISFIGFMESIAVAKSIQAKHKDYTIVPNQELVALGMANVVGSVFSSFPITGGFSRSAVNDQSGARSGLASIISGLLILLTLLLLTPYFYFLPHAVLSAIILVAVYGLIDIAEIKHLWHTDKQDFLLLVVTAVGTLAVGVEEGILIGLVLSLVALVYRVSYPHIAELSQVPDSRVYRNVNRFDFLDHHNQLLIVRFDAQLFFANCEHLRSYIDERLSNRQEVHSIIIHAGSIQSIDSSGYHALINLIDDYSLSEIKVYFTHVVGPVRDKMNQLGLVHKIGKDSFHLTVADAVDYIEGRSKPVQENIVLQSI